MRSLARSLWSAAFARIDRISVVEGWFRLFRFLDKLVLLHVLGRVSNRIKHSYGLVDAWVMGRAALSILVLWLSSAPGVSYIERAFIVIGIYSVSETLVVEVNNLFFGGYSAGKERKKHRVRSLRRLVATSLHNYGATIVWFALFYRNMDELFQPRSLNSFLTSLNFSFVTMTSFGHTDVAPWHSLGVGVTLIQSVVGVLMVLMILSGFIALLPPPLTMDASERDQISHLR